MPDGSRETDEGAQAVGQGVADVDDIVRDALGELSPDRLASMIRLAVSTDARPSEDPSVVVVDVKASNAPVAQSMSSGAGADTSWWSELLGRSGRRPSSSARRRLLATRHGGLRRRAR